MFSFSLSFCRRLLCGFLGAGLFAGGLARADYRDDIGWTRLQQELGANLPTGAGVSVTQVEAQETVAGNYLPDGSAAVFSGKTITPKSGNDGFSGHAFQVGDIYYGLQNSVASGVTAIDVYESNDWLSTGFLRLGNILPPLTENRDVQNHSWIGALDDGGLLDTEALRRFDFAIARDDFLACVGLNNGFGNPIPILLGNHYNALSVGLTNGNHSSGTTTADGAGRVKPEIVAPLDQTSFATPSVAAAGAFLLEKARSVPAWSEATRSVTLKALLLAGATKTPFPGWTRTTTRPLDAHYGAGQLNLYHSYYILVAGPQSPSSSVAVASRGWSFNTTAAAPRRYFFDIAPGNTVPRFSAVVTWHRTVSGVWPSATTSTLADLSLKLYAATGFTVGAVLDESLSPIDNLEHIHQPSLAPGRYCLEVSSPTIGVSYGLAWHSQQTVTLTAPVPVAQEFGLVPGSFTITRSGATTADLVAKYSVTGTAIGGVDYVTLPATLTIPAGASSLTTSITPLADTLAEGPETVAITLLEDFAYSAAGGTVAVTLADQPFDAWRFANFTSAELGEPAQSGPAADFESDGVENLAEYGLGLDPKTPDAARLPTTSFDPMGRLQLTYLPAPGTPDLLFTVEYSTNFSEWLTGPDVLSAPVLNQPGTPTGSYTVHSLVSRANAPDQFLRLRITRQ